MTMTTSELPVGKLW